VRSTRANRSTANYRARRENRTSCYADSRSCHNYRTAPGGDTRRRDSRGGIFTDERAGWRADKRTRRISHIRARGIDSAHALA
jgi:hypothetical protein